MLDERRLDTLHDAYLRALEESPDCRVVGYCECCGAELYEGYEALGDGDAFWCDEDCLKDYYSVKTVDLEYMED